MTAPRPPVPGRAGGPGEKGKVRGRGEAWRGMFPEETEGSRGEEMEGKGGILGDKWGNRAVLGSNRSCIGGARLAGAPQEECTSL